MFFQLQSKLRLVEFPTLVHPLGDRQLEMLFRFLKCQRTDLTDFFSEYLLCSCLEQATESEPNLLSAPIAAFGVYITAH